MAGGEERPQQFWLGLGTGLYDLCLYAAAELPVETFDGVGGTDRFPLEWVEPIEGEEACPGVFKAVGHLLTHEPPFAEECLAPLLDLGGGVDVDNVPIVFGQQILHLLGCVGQHIAMLLAGAASDRQFFARQRQQCGFQPPGHRRRSRTSVVKGHVRRDRQRTGAMPPCSRRPFL